MTVATNGRGVLSFRPGPTLEETEVGAKEGELEVANGVVVVALKGVGLDGVETDLTNASCPSMVGFGVDDAVVEGLGGAGTMVAPGGATKFDRVGLKVLVS